MILPIININGETRDNHIAGRLKVADAIMDVIAALSEIEPNGRDYPGAYDQCYADRQKHGERIAMLDKLRNTILDEALHIQREGA